MKLFTITFKQVLHNLSQIKDVNTEDLLEQIIEKFDGYEYKGAENLVGSENWGNISKDGKYELNIKLDHEDAYELTLYVTVLDNKATMTNVL